MRLCDLLIRAASELGRPRTARPHLRRAGRRFQSARLAELWYEHLAACGGPEGDMASLSLVGVRAMASLGRTPFGIGHVREEL